MKNETGDKERAATDTPSRVDSTLHTAACCNANTEANSAPNRADADETRTDFIPSRTRTVPSRAAATADATPNTANLTQSVSSESVTDISVKAGELVLENGGETYRAENTVVRIAKTLGAKTATAFVTPTVVMFSFTDDQNRHHSAFRRIFTRVVNLRKLCQVNTLFRRLEKREKQTNPAVIESVLRRIGSSLGYPPWMLVLCAACSSFCFAFVFGGTLKEAVCAFVAGLLLRAFLIRFEKLALNSFITSLFSGALISVLSGVSVRLGLLPSALIVNTAVLMQVVPGLALVNAIRDIIAGDLVSGTARLVEACMIAGGLSIGSVFGLVLL